MTGKFNNKSFQPTATEISLFFNTYSLSLKNSFNVLLNFLEYRTNSRFRISKTCNNESGKNESV